MPPLKNALPRNFSRNASGILTEVGHGRLLVIGDSSLDVPDNSQVFYWLGNKGGELSAAAALRGIAHACPIDADVPVRFMLKDTNDELDRPAPARNKLAIEALGLTAVGLEKDGDDGFYAYARGTDPHIKPPIYCLTAEEFAYDCIAATIGHSQV